MFNLYFRGDAWGRGYPSCRLKYEFLLGLSNARIKNVHPYFQGDAWKRGPAPFRLNRQPFKVKQDLSDCIPRFIPIYSIPDLTLFTLIHSDLSRSRVFPIYPDRSWIFHIYQILPDKFRFIPVVPDHYDYSRLFPDYSRFTPINLKSSRLFPICPYYYRWFLINPDLSRFIQIS